jgi:hemerythrin superfamily protein
MTEETPIKMLKSDHRKVESLFNECRQINPNDMEERMEKIKKIAKELEIHMDLEEQTFYPEVEKFSQEGAEMIKHAKEEHQKIKGIIGSIKNAMEGNKIEDQKLQELETNVTEHVKDEEERVFPFAESNLSDVLGVTFAAKMLAIKEKIRFQK